MARSTSPRETISRMFLLPYIMYIVLATFLVADYIYGVGGATCSADSCSQCLRAGENCAWCNDKNVNQSRCDSKNNLESSGCSQINIVYPEKQYIKIKAEPAGKNVQLSPQEITIKLRPKSKITVAIDFLPDKDYPMDLYYMMDVSQSMCDDKNTLVKLSDQLAEKLGEMTKDFRLGFGSFIDKNTFPYVVTWPDYYKRLSESRHRCITIDKVNCCPEPFGFKNNLPLNENPLLFKEAVNEASFSGSSDIPEGGLDALMQVIVCQDIGWRQRSRKLVVYASDAGFHISGDGKLGGVVEPNDGKCHLDEDGLYTHSLKMDAPSVGHISKVISENNINMIFAVTGEKFLYKDLVEMIPGAEYGELDSTSNNIDEIIGKAYQKIRDRIELKATDVEGVHVEFSSACLGTEMKKVSICEDISLEDKITFEMTLEMTSCPVDPGKWNVTMEVFPVGLSEKLSVNLEFLCECPCEQEKISNSVDCTEAGTLECGQCYCNQGHFGKHCQCDSSNIDNTDQTPCYRGNDTEACSGRGECVCGLCTCHPIASDSSQRYSGQNCERNDYSCQYYDDKICGGEGRGKCRDGVCECHFGYSGESCKCFDGTCLAESGVECDGHGICECGKCVCEGLYQGSQCQECPTCSSTCDHNRACVECWMLGPEDQEDCTANCTHVNIVPSIKEDTSQYKTCQYKDELGCVFYFNYEYLTKKVYARKDKECPVEVNTWYVIVGVVGGILLIGILLLVIWRVWASKMDRKEYEKFQREQANECFARAANPLYKPVVSEFHNPAFGDRKIATEADEQAEAERLWVEMRKAESQENILLQLRRAESLENL